ncbi:ATP-binding protein [Pseudarthrobacter sulfonivorans]|uniref:ATP-binding protein n=1 Tax=Pseudarthrobacter sulfonivorans TaxID=121292 RepID=UPI000AFDB5E0|nr:ATP-binding protein [Pseudarthrobacter sulfonivorans]
MDQPRGNLVVCGPSGTGKTFFLEALGQQAVEAGMRVAWFRLEGPGGGEHVSDLAFVSLAGRPFRAENVPVVACRRRGSMVHSGRDLAGDRCGPFTVSFAENED